MMMKAMAKRPRLKPYGWSLIGLSGLWMVMVVGMTTMQGAPATDEEIGYMSSAIRWGIGAVVALTGLVYAGHWGVKAAWTDRPTTNTEIPAPVTCGSVHESLDEPGLRVWSLELRGVGAGANRVHQVELWDAIQRKRDNFASIYSQNPEDYIESVQEREDAADRGTGIAFRLAATDSVAYWPIPTFTVEPPNLNKSDDSRAAGLTSEGANSGSLGVTLFLWQEDANTTHAQDMVERLFQFFDTHPEVPEAMIATRDGDQIRNRYRERSTPALPSGRYLPKVLDNTAVLLVSRSDRVDRYLRPYAPDYREDNQNQRTDLGKLWAFYHAEDRNAAKVYEEAERLRGIQDPLSPGTMTSAYWQSTLPELWKNIDNRGPGDFKPTPWLPVRWALHQVDEFDRAPILGHLHRPVKVTLRDEQGQLLKPALQVIAMKAGWEQALATLPEGEKPMRVFYDSTGNMDSAIALTNALHELNIDGHGLELGNVDEGYDIGRRLGDTGLGSALVQIGLGAIASYKDGGASAVMYAGDNGSISLQMVRPPSAEEKLHNRPYSEADPFMYRARAR
ncbi:DUF2875 family protein [Stenotrophomonas terrae]|uniref:type VI lipase adapter Tla3 domain-containing protein n=1 Tax=Stenotrophomonas terrae TaxID=405446 RepID=UPI003209A1FB